MGVEEELYVGQTSDFTDLWKIITVLSSVKAYTRESCHGLGICACFLKDVVILALTLRKSEGADHSNVQSSGT